MKSVPQSKAAALKYPDGADAPFITAAARGELAERLLEIARENSVPVVRDELLADVLTVQEIGSVIPEETWELVAGIFSFILDAERSASDPNRKDL